MESIGEWEDLQLKNKLKSYFTFAVRFLSAFHANARMLIALGVVLFILMPLPLSQLIGGATSLWRMIDFSRNVATAPLVEIKTIYVDGERYQSFYRSESTRYFSSARDYCHAEYTFRLNDDIWTGIGVTANEMRFQTTEEAWEYCKKVVYSARTVYYHAQNPLWTSLTPPVPEYFETFKWLFFSLLALLASWFGARWISHA